MSVAWYSDGELRALYDALGGERADMGNFPHGLAVALTGLGLANRCAHFATYGAEDGEQTIPIPDILGVTPEHDSWGRTVRVTVWASNLIYNCVTNAGTDFAPPAYAAALLCAARSADAHHDGAVPEVIHA